MTPSHYPLIDAHTHLETVAERSERQEKQILSLVCASTPSEAEELLKITNPYLLPTAGLHPWQAASYSINDMLPYLAACPVIGEIGMDSVWCDVSTDRQEEVFRAQLAIARQMKKPVILHTKGEEGRIASILPEYPNTYLIHWYSCEDYLDRYLALDCYFSVGPDVLWNPPVRALAARVPLDRILIETDGMEAVRWAYEAPEAPKSSRLDDARANTGSVEDALTRTLLETAAIRQTDPDTLALQIQKNLIWGFLSASRYDFPDEI